MKRKVKFRGKRTDGKGWVYGDLMQRYIHHEGLTIVEGGCVYYEVDQATVGQFTGMTDREGREIYEGDLLNVHSLNFDGYGEAEAQTNGIIRWGELGWHLCSVTGWIAEYMGYEEGDPKAEAKLSDIIPAHFMDADHADGDLLHHLWGQHEGSYTVLGNTHDTQQDGAAQSKSA